MASFIKLNEGKTFPSMPVGYSVATKFTKKDDVVDSDGKTPSAVYRGRRYRLIAKYSRDLSGGQRCVRILLGLLLTLISVGIALSSKKVRGLYTKKVTNIRYGRALPLSANGTLAAMSKSEIKNQYNGVCARSKLARLTSQEFKIIVPYLENSTLKCSIPMTMLNEFDYRAMEEDKVRALFYFDRYDTRDKLERLTEENFAIVWPKLQQALYLRKLPKKHVNAFDYSRMTSSHIQSIFGEFSPRHDLIWKREMVEALSEKNFSLAFKILLRDRELPANLKHDFADKFRTPQQRESVQGLSDWDKNHSGPQAAAAEIRCPTISDYRLLGVARGANAEEIAAARKKQLRAHHPDLVARQIERRKEENEEQFARRMERALSEANAQAQRINEACDVLSHWVKSQH